MNWSTLFQAAGLVFAFALTQPSTSFLGILSFPRSFSRILWSYVASSSSTFSQQVHLPVSHRPFARISPQTTTRLSMSTGQDEVKAAQEAGAADTAAPTVFDKIISGEWSSDKVFEDDRALAFRDINPQAPVHVLVIPKVRDGLTQIVKAREDQEALLGHLLYVAKSVGEKECPEGFRLVINDGVHGAQSVYHLHIHVLGGRQLSWPPG